MTLRVKIARDQFLVCLYLMGCAEVQGNLISHVFSIQFIKTLYFFLKFFFTEKIRKVKYNKIFFNIKYISVLQGNAEIIKLLLKNGADRECQDDFGITPLFVAAQYGKPESLNILMSSGKSHQPLCQEDLVFKQYSWKE